MKFRVGFAYSEIGAAYNPADDEYLLESGLGAHLPVIGPLVLEPGVHHSLTQKTDESFGDNDVREHLHYRVRAGYRLGRHVELFAGGGVRHAAWGEHSGGTDPEVFAGLGVH
jgi:hypothetical protein